MDFCGSFCARENRTEKRAAVRAPMFGMVACTLFALMISNVPLLAQSPGYSDFSSATNLAHNGDAAVPFHDGSVNLLRVNPAFAGQRGSAWFNVLQPVAGGF